MTFHILTQSYGKQGQVYIAAIVMLSSCGLIRDCKHLRITLVKQDVCGSLEVRKIAASLDCYYVTRCPLHEVRITHRMSYTHSFY